MPRPLLSFPCLLAAGLALVVSGLRAHPITPEPARVAGIAAWMHAGPDAFTPAFDDRAFWAPLAATPAGRAVIARADALAAVPLPALPDDLYDDFRKTGRRKPYEVPYGKRIKTLDTLTLAEGVAGAGRYLSSIGATITALLDEPSWALPAHAGKRATRADAYDLVDLGAINRAWSLATADYLLGDRLPAPLRARIREEVGKRVFKPYLERVRSGDPRDFWWMRGTNNWNAVCHAGVLGSALLLVDSPEKKALFAAAFETGTRHFLSGFGDDGFCQEGTGYWNYGFGHFLLGAEAVKRATGGKLDLLASPKVRSIAAFGSRYEIANNIYPAFSDVPVSAKPAGWITDFIAVRFGLGTIRGEPTLDKDLFTETFDLSLPRKTISDSESRALPSYDWFPDGGAMILRNAPAASGLSVALKGGNNNQPHNHDDLGTFVVVNDGALALTDLGGDTYVKDTFGPRRYTSEVLNSFGHPVPRVAGKLQRTGAAARAVTVRTNFSDDGGLWEQDLTSAYDVPALKRLTRTFAYTRAKGGRLEITDHAVFTTPQAFGTAIILRPGQSYSKTGNTRYRVGKGRAAVEVVVDAGEATLTVSEDPVHGIVPDQPPRGLRLGFDLAAPAAEVTIRTVITPVQNAPEEAK